MIEVKVVDQIADLRALKQEYIDQTSSPLDGMWLTGFIPLSTHYGFYEEGQLIGYCCVDGKGYLLQFYVIPNKQNQASLLFDSIVAKQHSSVTKVIGAFSSTAEPNYFSLCLDSFADFTVNAFMYQLDSTKKSRIEYDPAIQLTLATPEQLNDFVEFTKANMGSQEEWLRAYNTRLISRQELFGVWQKGQLIALGELRAYDDFQREYADLGVIVENRIRGKGLGTMVLGLLIAKSKAKGLIPICSAEKANIGSQKAISKAGFVSSHRIVQFKN